MSAQPEPTHDELLAMAFVDGELSPEESVSFEARVSGAPELARHVAHYQSLELLTRQMAPAEPADHEWARLDADALQTAGSWIGWTLVGAGGLGLAGYGIYGLATASAMNPVPRACLLCLIGGLALLLGVTIRARINLLPFDPYRKIKR